MDHKPEIPIRDSISSPFFVHPTNAPPHVAVRPKSPHHASKSGKLFFRGRLSGRTPRTMTFLMVRKSGIPNFEISSWCSKWAWGLWWQSNQKQKMPILKQWQSVGKLHELTIHFLTSCSAKKSGNFLPGMPSLPKTFSAPRQRFRLFAESPIPSLWNRRLGTITMCKQPLLQSSRIFLLLQTGRKDNVTPKPSTTLWISIYATKKHNIYITSMECFYV